MHYYQFNIADYRKDTTHLTPIEHYAYRQLLDQYYLTEQPISLDESKIMRSLCVRIADDMQAVRNVLQDFFLKTENGYIHKRCDIEIEAYHAKSKSASESAKVRWANKNKVDNKDAMRSHTEGNANHKPETINQEPLTNLKPTPIADKSALPFPDFIDLDLWKDFLEVRKGLKAKNTLPAIRALIKQLIKLKDQGHDPSEVVMTSIRSSWKDLYPLKDSKTNGSNVYQNKQDQLKEYNRTNNEKLKQRLFGTQERDITNDTTTVG